MTLDEALNDIELVLNSPGVNCAAFGSYNAERTRCNDCGRDSDGWHNYSEIDHREGCKTVLGDQAEMRLRAAIKEKNND